MKRMKSNEKVIDFYTKLHINTINSSDLIHYAKQRMKILRRLESKHAIQVVNTFKNTDDDIASHFCMRLIAAQTLYSLKWFVNLETIYFSKQLKNFDEKDISKFFYGTFIKSLSNTKTDGNCLYITQDSQFTDVSNDVNTKLDVKIHFTKALSSLKTGLPENGYFELDFATMKACISDMYSIYLEKKLYELYDTIKYETDERLLSIHNELFTIQEYKDKNTLKDLVTLLPPCMTGIIAKMKSNKHIKYKDRLTLTRFLKDMNVPLEETIRFMKNNFNVDEQTFAKEYLYSIRHTYGLEGKRANYQSYGCSHVIKSGDNTTFGCPFRFNEAYVMEYAKERSIDIENIGARDECQMKCTKVLGKMCNTKIDEVVSSPVTFVKTYKDAIEAQNKENKD